MVAFAFAEVERSPCTQRKIVFIIDRIGLATVVIFDCMWLRFLAESRQATLRTIHHQLHGFHIEIDQTLLPFGVVELQANHLNTARYDVHHHLVSTIIGGQHLVEFVVLTFKCDCIQGAALFTQLACFRNHIGSHIGLAIFCIK